jgi:hypothetical protein
VEDMAIAASAYDIPAFVTDFRQSEAEKQAGVRLSKVILAVEEMSIDGQQIPAPEPVTQQEPVRFPLHHHLDVIHGQGSVALQLELPCGVMSPNLAPSSATLATDAR